MNKTLEFPGVLRLIDEQSAAFDALVAAAPDLDVPVPTCPEWTLFDLAEHLGQGRRAWGAIVTAGPSDTRAATAASQGPAPRDRADLAAWLAESTRQLLDPLRESGPDRGCWTWWGASQSPQTSGAVARHRLQEAAVHMYDAQLATGAPEPVPVEVALDGVDEFVYTCCATTAPWPHEPAVVDYHVSEGRSWRLRLSAAGAHAADLPAGGAGTDADPADATARGTAGDLLLVLYGRLPLDALDLSGALPVFDQLVEWEPEP